LDQINSVDRIIFVSSNFLFSGADVAQGYSLAVAKALAMTAIDIMSKPELIPKIQQDFRRDLQNVS
jgi:hypothetical protein